MKGPVWGGAWSEPKTWRPRVAVFDTDEDLFRIVSATLGSSVRTEAASNWAEIRAWPKRGADAPDAYVIGSSFGESQSLEYATTLAAYAPMRVVWVLRRPTERSICLASGAGVILAPHPPPESMIQALRRSCGGPPRCSAALARVHVCQKIAARLGLTDREVEIVHFLLEGLDSSDIADALDISERTVQVHLGRILRKAGMPKTQLFVVRAFHEVLEMLSKGLGET